jgi:hypothetical protein
VLRAGGLGAFHFALAHGAVGSDDAIPVDDARLDLGGLALLHMLSLRRLHLTRNDSLLHLDASGSGVSTEGDTEHGPDYAAEYNPKSTGHRCAPATW